MSESIGITVLRHVADHYRRHPGSWVTGAGSLANRMGEDAASIQAALKMQGETGCKDTLIICYAAIVAGDSGRAVAERDARRLFCEYLNRRTAPDTIHCFNDSECKTQAKAIEHLDAAILKAMEPRTQPAKVPAKVRARQLVTASLAGILVLGTIASSLV